jgi:hypothetical protein
VQGQTLLQRVITDRFDGNVTACASDCEIPRPQLSMYCSGRRRPGLDHANTLNRRYSIPTTAWSYPKARRSRKPSRRRS